MKKRSLAASLLAVLLVALLPLGGLGHGDTDQHGLDFNGIDNWVQTPDSADFTFSDLTLTFWFNGSDVGNQQSLVRHRDVGAFGTASGFVVEINNDDISTNTALEDIDGDFVNCGTATDVFSDNVWHFVVLERNGTTMRVLVDDNEVCTDTDAGFTNVVNSNQILYFGQIANGRFFDGILDDARLYNETLTEAQQTSLFNGDEDTLSGLSSLVLDSRMNDGEGQIASDSSGNGNDGQLGSAPGADANDPTWVTPVCEAGEWWLLVPCPAPPGQIIDQIPSYIDQVTSDTTTNASYEDVDGLTVNVIVFDRSNIFLIATISANATGAATAGWKLVFNGIDYHELERSISTEPGNIVLIDLAENIATGTYAFKLQHKTSAETLTTFNTTIMAVSLHDGNGPVPAGQDFVASDTMAGATTEDVDGLEFTVTTFTDSFLWVGVSYMGEVNALNKHSNTRIVIDGLSQDLIHRAWDTANQKGCVSSLIRGNVRLTPGIHTVKAEWQTEGGTTLTGTNFSIVAFAGEADQGDRRFHIAKDIVSQDTTTATTMEDIDGLSVTAEPPASSHVFSTLNFWQLANDTAVSVMHTIEINGTDDITMERGFATAGANGEGSIGQVARTSSEVSSVIVIQGRWHTETDVTVTGNNLVLTSVVLRTEEADPEPEAEPESAMLLLLIAAILVFFGLVGVVAMKKR